MVNLDEIEALLGASTQGPWCDRRIGRTGNGLPSSQHEQICNADGVAVFMVEHDGGVDGDANVRLAMSAVTVLPALLAELRAARELLAVIHQDGGQHVETVGFAKACEDAIDAVRVVRAEGER